MPQDRRKVVKVQIRDALIYWVWLPAAVIAGGKGIDRLAGSAPFPKAPGSILLALALIIAGVVLIQRSTRDLAVYGEGTPNPLAPPVRLVTRGSYALCRHPMFFGYDLAALGVVLLFRSPGMLAVSYPLFLAWEVRFLKREEEQLRRRFGKEFDAYRQETAFLVPLPGGWRGRR